MGYYEKPIDVPGMPEGFFLLEINTGTVNGRLQVIVSNPNGGAGLAQCWMTPGFEWVIRMAHTPETLARQLLAAIDAIRAWELAGRP
jgi:hypothetical protein